MPKVAKDAAYYLNGRIPAVALVAKGVRLPAGTWIRIAEDTAVAQHIEDVLGEMFPALKGKVITFVTLMSELDVEQFERSLSLHKPG